MSDARKRPARTQQRVAFKTSRLAEFCGEKELAAQTGHSPEDWPLVIAKEGANRQRARRVRGSGDSARDHHRGVDRARRDRHRRQWAWAGTWDD
jgi:hypothetical protein